MNPLGPTTTQAVDAVFLFIFGVSLVMLLGITATMIYFVIKYNRKRHPVPTSEVSSNWWLEIIWTLIPTVLVMGMFYYGWAGYLALRNVPEGAMEVTVTGRMWSWSFEYENGRIADKLHVPVGAPVKVSILSEDVLHSFFIPAFRVKMDAVPGMETYVWFRADEAGSYDIFCAEYCGVGHADMITTVEALPEEEFERWYAAEAEEEEGLKLLKKYGCLGCHSLDGTPGVGPTLKKIIGRQQTVISGGVKRTITVDEAYLLRSLTDPGADIAEGFPPIMPSFEKVIPQKELEKIVEYLLRPSGEEGKSESAGAALLEGKGCAACHSTDGSRKVGPTFKGISGRKVKVRRGGESVVIESDAGYIRRSISDPQADLVEGYPPIMPKADLSVEEMEAILLHLESLE